MKSVLPIAFALAAFAAGAPAAERALDKEVVVKAGVDAVWDAWTTKAGITAFFAYSRFRGRA